MTIDKNKKYRTRDGRDVRIYATDGSGDHTVHGEMLCESGWMTTAWLSNGAFCHDRESDTDLIEVPADQPANAPLDLDKPVEVVFPDGVLPARIICNDARGDCPIIALVECDANECAMAFTIDGKRFLDTYLRNRAPEKRKVTSWMVLDGDCRIFFKTKEEAWIFMAIRPGRIVELTGEYEA